MKQMESAPAAPITVAAMAKERAGKGGRDPFAPTIQGNAPMSRRRWLRRCCWGRRIFSGGNREVRTRWELRRAFLKNGALALVGTAAIPSFLTRAVMAQATAASTSRKKLVVIFQRGAADGLNIVIPHASLRISDAADDCHSAATDSRPGWILRAASCHGEPEAAVGARREHLAIVHAAGSPDMTRSHFDAQDYMESGTPGMKATEDGWLIARCRQRMNGSGRPRLRSRGGSDGGDATHAAGEKSVLLR